MPVFGPTFSEDGVVGVANDGAHSGLVGRNDSAATPSPPGGSGVLGLTVAPGAAGVFGANTGRVKGVGVQGNGPEVGVSGYSQRGLGLRAISEHGDGMHASTGNSARNAVVASNTATVEPEPGGPPVGNGVLATTTVWGAAGVFGANNHPERGVGVQGNGPEAGLSGYSPSGVGVRADGPLSGVAASSESGPGVVAHSAKADGTQSFAHDVGGNGLLGMNDAKVSRFEGRLTRAKVSGFEGRLTEHPHAPTGNGVFGFTHVLGGSGVCGAIDPGNRHGAGITGIGPIAGHFFGNVIVTGDIQLGGADYAEDFDVSGDDVPEPGTVMVLGEDGEQLCESQGEYDPRVAGIVCGAGSHRPGLILDRRPSIGLRIPIALLGKVYCKVDALKEPIRVGDVLTTSGTPGHAMRATDRERAFGAVIGKALAHLPNGRGLIPVLVGLQ